jgi:uncharacterized protein YbjT (DUF2867 family)
MVGYTSGELTSNPNNPPSEVYKETANESKVFDYTAYEQRRRPRKENQMFNENMPLITIVGATSKQGRSAAHTLLASGRYRVRALTRNVYSPEARSLAAQGAEPVAVPLEVGRTRELVQAFRGSHGAFLITPPIIPPSAHEADLGKQQADAAVEAGVQHVIYSALENVDKITGGEKFVPHFTDKARVEEYIRGLPVQSSFVYLAFFYTNLIEFFPPHMEGDTLVFPIYLPGDFRAPFVNPLTATGPAVLEIFANPTQYAGKSLPVVGDIISPNEMVETFQRVTGKKAAYRSAYTRDELLRYFPALFGANELFVREILGMVEYAVKYGYFQPHRDLEWSRKIDPTTLTWEGFLRKTNWQGEAMSFGLAAGQSQFTPLPTPKRSGRRIPGALISVAWGRALRPQRATANECR